MKTIGILGGMSDQATAEYYRRINAGVQQRLGGWSTAELMICSVNFAHIEEFICQQRWNEAADYLAGKARQLERGGADFIVMATNTMHRVAPTIEAAVEIPLVHIVDVAAAAILQRGLTRVGVLGTQPVMEADFYRQRFAQHGLEVVVPEDEQRQVVHRIIFDELVFGAVKDASRQRYLAIMREMAARGAQGVVLGCTEIEMLVKPKDIPELPLFDTTELHCRKAVELALQ